MIACSASTRANKNKYGIQSDTQTANKNSTILSKPTHPFFMKISEKKELKEQQKNCERVQILDGVYPPKRANDKEQPTLEPAKQKRLRKNQPTSKQRMTRARKNSPDEKTLSLSTLVNSASQDSILDSITVKATPTPSSSPPTVDEPITEAEAEIDLNHERRKRCKRIPPLKSLACELDSDTGSILGSSPAQTPGYKDKFEVSYNCPILKVHALNELGKEHLSKFKDLSLSPVLPPASVPPDSDISSSSGHSLHRARTYYQRETGIFTIKSSPQPTQLSLRSAFTVLGKLQDTEAPSRKSKKIGQASNKKRAGKTKDKEKERVEESGDIQPTVTNAASIDLKSCIAEEKPLHLFPEKPVVHPFFNVTERKRMAQSSLIQKPAISDNSKTLLPAKDESRKANSPQLSVSQHPNQSNRLQSGWNLTSTLGMRVECRAAKLPGLTDAPWPIKRTSHIRGLSTSECNNKSIDTRQIPQKRRLKEASITLTPQESVLNKLSVNLGIGKLMDCINSDDYEEQKYLQVAPEVKLPTRQVMTGQQLQDMVRSRVSARLPHLKALYSHNDLSDSDSSDDNTIIHSGVHPALLHLYKRLGSELTAFDKHQSETIPWEVKYAPQSVGEILQVGREMDVCRRWLLELRTDSLISGKGKRKAKGSAGGSKNGAAKKKRRKKDDDLDSFVVSEEDERTLMSDITDSEEDDWTKPVIKTKKSTIRKRDKPHGLPMISSKDSEKKTNAIVISGPNGCGKTAAVYAIAKELGYAVFEVNPGSRRTGKDVLDQVGDMAKNHLVHQANTCDVSNPFTKAKTAKEAVVAFEDDIQLRQQQSLILFEEVDILFEEDKNFWSTVLSLLSKSKRPIVLTCNDESHLPWDELSLHAVLRFSMPSRDLLVDHLLLICANEGHLIQRSAIDVLVVANKFDIRASIMNLQFYCRMAIGDHTGGFNWIIDRWPVGSDTTEDGEKLRVVSENTYYEGMGWVLNSPNASEEHRWRSVWEEYALDIGATGMGVEECTCEIEQSGVSKIESLKIADGFFEARSAADTFALNGLCTSHKSKLDISYPIRSSKSMLDDLCGYHIVQADRRDVPGSVETEISISMRLLAHQNVATKVKGITQLSLTNGSIINSISNRHDPEGVDRLEMQKLFSPLSKAEAAFTSTPATTQSSVYPSVGVLAAEVAPWVRSILRYDLAMEKARRQSSNLLSTGGKRRTRAARLAIEGGDRGRKERWFRGLGASALVRSSGRGWDAEPQMQTLADLNDGEIC